MALPIRCVILFVDQDMIQEVPEGIVAVDRDDEIIVRETDEGVFDDIVGIDQVFQICGRLDDPVPELVGEAAARVHVPVFIGKCEDENCIPKVRKLFVDGFDVGLQHGPIGPVDLFLESLGGKTIMDNTDQHHRQDGETREDEEELGA